MSIKLVTPAATAPMTLAEAKLHCRVDASITADDALITTLVKAATRVFQAMTGRQLVFATFMQAWDYYPGMYHPPRVINQASGHRVFYQGIEAAMVPLMIEPVSEVSWVKYYDMDEVQQTVDPTSYYVDIDSTPPRVVPKQTWPDILLGKPGAFQIQYIAGYGAAADVPEDAKTAIGWLVSTWYENREMMVLTGGVPKEVPFGFAAICGLYEVGHV